MAAISKLISQNAIPNLESCRRIWSRCGKGMMRPFIIFLMKKRSGNFTTRISISICSIRNLGKSCCHWVTFRQPRPTAAADAANDRPIFELIEGEGDKAVSHPLFSIPEILQKILEIGRRGVQIKRFKGLGEMNAKELFETTMNPEKRKLLQVDITDETKADEMFARLMGELVEPRRQYIEDNALNVRN